MNKTLTTSLLGGALLAGSAFAGEVAAPIVTETPSSFFESSLAVGYHSQYIFRGVNSGDDLVDATLNTAWTCPFTGLDMSAGAWYGSVKNGFGAGSYDELDLYGEVAKDLGFANASVGYVFYHFFDAADDAQEVYFGLSKEIYGFETGIKYFWDIETDNQGYLEGTVSKSFDIMGGFSLDTGVAVGYLVEEGALSHVTAKVSHDFKLGESATLTPYVAYSVELDDLEQYVGTDEENEFFAGAALTVIF